jgi:CRP-like cAMP-binding protein
VIDASGSTVRVPTPDKTEAAFKSWLRRLVTGTAELEAFDAGEIDAVIDRDSGHALLLPAAQSALRGSSHIELSVLDTLPGEICIVDAHGAVVTANKAWRASGVKHARAGLDVRTGEDFFAACRDAPASERIHADAAAAGLREVLAGVRQSLRLQYVCPTPRGRSEFTLTMAATSDQGRINALLTREWDSDPGKVESAALPAKKPRRDTPVLPAAAENRLLAALPEKDYARLKGSLELVTVSFGDVLYEPDERMRFVYFPSSCLVSLLTLVEGNRCLEVGLVGREGMIGARLALGATTSSVRALVQGTGTAMRMNAEDFLRELRRSQPLQRVLLQFTDNLMAQIGQTAVCNRFHVVEARVARWLMMTADRMRCASFHLTHGFIADMLGVRREGVTVAAIELQRRGVIRYRRGNITVLDHRGLEAACCPCYRHLQRMEAAGR